MSKKRVLFLDIGGVLLSNGWDHQLRKKAAIHFHLDEKDLEERHEQFYPLHEIDAMDFNSYLRLLRN